MHLDRMTEIASTLDQRPAPVMCGWHRFLVRLARFDRQWRTGLHHAARFECRRCQRATTRTKEA